MNSQIAYFRVDRPIKKQEIGALLIDFVWYLMALFSNLNIWLDLFLLYT